ncbi:MAG: hypothetical protein A2804_02310 [Candidatus Pacebacteria bacterium RIFCSPHIGHO2_01_FULL_46_10]|nr:MAG: hypothetical protein A2804_02310 [Candidatus Pacebacteria bacterium RIFCSPHIGHO2_01_FULL_46_10]
MVTTAEQLGARRPTARETMLGRRITAIQNMIDIPFEKGVELRDLEGTLARYKTQQDVLHFFQHTQRHLHRFLTTPRQTFERAKQGIVNRVTRVLTQYQRTHAAAEERRAEDTANQQEERRRAEEARVEALLKEYLRLDTMYRNNQDLTMEEGARYGDLQAYLSVKETQEHLIQTFNDLSQEFATATTSLERKMRLATILATVVLYFTVSCSGPGSVTPPTQEATKTQVQSSPESATAQPTQAPENTPQVEQSAPAGYRPEEVFSHPENFTVGDRIDEATLQEIAAIPADQQANHPLILKYRLLSEGAKFFLGKIDRMRNLAATDQTQLEHPAPKLEIKKAYLCLNADRSAYEILAFADDAETQLVILTSTTLDANGVEQTYTSGQLFNYEPVVGPELNTQWWRYTTVTLPGGGGSVTMEWNAEKRGYVVMLDTSGKNVTQVLDATQPLDALWQKAPEQVVHNEFFSSYEISYQGITMRANFQVDEQLKGKYPVTKIEFNSLITQYLPDITEQQLKERLAQAWLLGCYDTWVRDGNTGTFDEYITLVRQAQASRSPVDIQKIQFKMGGVDKTSGNTTPQEFFANPLDGFTYIIAQGYGTPYDGIPSPMLLTNKISRGYGKNEDGSLVLIVNALESSDSSDPQYSFSLSGNLAGLFSFMEKSPFIQMNGYGEGTAPLSELTPNTKYVSIVDVPLSQIKPGTKGYLGILSSPGLDPGIDEYIKNS